MRTQIRARTCGKKKRFPSKAVAEVMRQKIVGETMCPDESLNCYRCAYCHQWHVGHTPGYGLKR